MLSRAESSETVENRERRARCQAPDERHGFEGHLFEKRYWSRLIVAEEHLAATIAYIAFNPVKAGLCAVPWEWRWSSFFEVDKSFTFD